MKHASQRFMRRVLRNSAILMLLIASICFVALVGGGKNASAEEPKAQARQLWEAAITAKGGCKRLRSISSLFVKADIGGGDRVYTLYVFPDYKFEYSYWAQRERTDILVYNAMRNITWWQLNGEAAKPLKSDNGDVYSNILPQIMYLLMSKDMEATPVGNRKERIGLKRVDVVETDVNGWRVDYYLDPDTHLPIKLAFPGGPEARAKGEMNHLITLEDYVDVAGVMMPRQAIHSFTFNLPKRTDRLTFEINPKYDQSIFEQPPTPKMGPEAWRLKGKTVASDPK